MEIDWNKNFAITFQFLYRANNPNDVPNVMIAGQDVKILMECWMKHLSLKKLID